MVEYDTITTLRKFTITFLEASILDLRPVSLTGPGMIEKKARVSTSFKFQCKNIYYEIEAKAPNRLVGPYDVFTCHNEIFSISFECTD